MAKKYKIYPIKTIKDWEGEDWDVYMEIKTSHGFTLYRGWPYGMRANDEGMNGVFSFILTTELADFLKAHGSTEVRKLLKISNSVVSKFRRRLNIQKKLIRRDYQWIFEHQAEILNDSFQSLKSKYGLTKVQVLKYSAWLTQEKNAKRSHKLRMTSTRHIREEWYQKHFTTLKTLDAKAMQQQFNLSRSTARIIYDRISDEIGRPGLVEINQKKKYDKRQWLIENQHELLSDEIKVEQIADHLGKTPKQILMARNELRKILDITVEDEVINWVKHNLDEVITTPRKQLEQKYQLTEGQTIYRKKLRKGLKINELQFT